MKMQIETAPIVLFVYNRPWHTRQTLEALARNELTAQSVLYIYADGPKENADEKISEQIKKTRELIRSRQWCKEVIIYEKENNSGLANSIIAGVTEIVNRHGKIIVLEDDLIVSPYFLQYMNDGLKVYENETGVISIHAYNYPVNIKGLPETFFIKGADCWGWATWVNRWNLFEKDAEKLLKEIESKHLQFEFDIQNSYPYTQMLKDQVGNKIDSWAIRWYASAFLKNKYTLYPNISIVNNIGMDGTGTHGSSIGNFRNNKWNNSRRINIVYTDKIENNNLVLSRWKNYHRQNNKGIRRRSASTIQKLKFITSRVFRRNRNIKEI
ncbi:MAG: hypothetical protein ABI863_18350 [Ginsengibacter sp.]